MYDSRLVMSDSATPRTATQKAPLSMEFSRQEYWGGLSFPSPGDLPNPGTEPRSPTSQADSLPSESPGQNRLSPFKIVVSVWGQNFCFFQEYIIDIK